MLKKTSSIGRELAVVLVLAIIAAPSVMAQPNYLENGAFDSGIDGWTFFGDATGSMSWDGSLGDPSPGSLRIEANNSSVVSHSALSECFEAPPGSTWHLRGLAREAPGSTDLSCGYVLYVYFNPDCSDPTSAGSSSAAVATNDWTEISVDLTIPDGFLGLRAAPTLGASTLANGVCNFDRIELTGPPNFAEVPASGPGALALLIAVLGGTGFLLLRRLR